VSPGAAVPSAIARFEPFVPRVVSRRDSAASRTGERALPEVPIASSVDEQPPAASICASADAVVPDSTASAPVPPAIDVDALVRERAIEIAGAACARALHEAIARNRLFVARFVDDAIAAAGRSGTPRVRLSPDDAAACAVRPGIDVIADAAIAPGEVVVESEDTAVRATIEERAALLARAAADA
jgi:flagellar assembly protein FliH